MGGGSTVMVAGDIYRALKMCGVLCEVLCEVRHAALCPHGYQRWCDGPHFPVEQTLARRVSELAQGHPKGPRSLTQT